MEIVRVDRGDRDITFVPDEISRYDYVTSGQPFTANTAHLDSIIYAGDIPYRWHRLETIPLHRTEDT